jgi:hypothetical protein
MKIHTNWARISCGFESVSKNYFLKVKNLLVEFLILKKQDTRNRFEDKGILSEKNFVKEQARTNTLTTKSTII